MTVRQPKNGTHYTAIDTPPKVILEGFEPTRTRQSEAAACNINTIMARYEKTGMLPPDVRDAIYEDVSNMPNYRESLDLIRQADDMFMQLPAKLRSKFHNEPAEFLDWTSDPDNRDEMVELGMLPKPEPIVEPGVKQPIIVPDPDPPPNP